MFQTLQPLVYSSEISCWIQAINHCKVRALIHRWACAIHSRLFPFVRS